MLVYFLKDSILFKFLFHNSLPYKYDCRALTLYFHFTFYSKDLIIYFSNLLAFKLNYHYDSF